ncbi:signal peptide peptidase SppA [candidate division WOR-3 bacterium]|nr:signal peptide peptidase SppA [candidate division WOR-3 bacterium]
MTYLLILSFVNLSVATSERSRALYSNPAGLSMHSSPEMSIRTEDFWLSLNLPFIGMSGGIRFMSDSIEYMTGTCPIHFKDRFSLGYSYASWNDKHTIGVMARPFWWTSLGATTTFPSRDGYNFNVGFAFMPGWNRLILSSDFYIDREVDGIEFSVESLSGTIEILDGIRLSVSYLPQKDDFNNGELYGGLEFSLGTLLFGGYSSSEGDAEGIITASFIPYPTMMRPKPNSVIIEIGGNYPETPAMKGLFGKEHSFYNLLNLLDYIREKKGIDTVLIHLKRNTLGLAQAEEVRELLEEMAKDKTVILYSHSLGFKGLYIASAVDIIALPPSGEIYFPGIYITKMFLKGTLDKLDIKPQFERVGRYKSAVEMFTKKEISKSDQEQLEKFLDDLVEVVVAKIGAARGIEDEVLKSLIDSLGYFVPEVASQKGLIDTVLYFDQVKEMARIKGKGKVWRGKSIPRDFVVKGIPKIAIVTLEGTIVLGKSTSSPLPIPFIGGKFIGAETTVEILDKLRVDKSVKAVVLRIDSGGGESLASDLIYRAILRLKDEKPVIISMGNVAASGGYLIAAPGTKILADRTTLTGSIGIFGGKFVTEGFYNKLGITHEVVKWGKHADAMSGHRPFTHYEREMYGKMVRHGYEQFLESVAKPRKLSTEEVDSVGMGRIWSGYTAKTISLIDQYGGLLTAIKVAGDEAGIERYRVVLLPKPFTFLERLLDLDEDIYLPVFKMLSEPYLYYEPARLEVGE